MNSYEQEARVKRAPKEQLVAVMQGRSDDYPQWMALAELNRRREIGVATDGMKAQQQLAQGKTTVKDRRMAEMLPEGAGIGLLPAENMAVLAAAEGGVMGYAGGGDVQGYAPGGSIILNGVEYPIDPETGKVMYKGVPTDPKLLQQSAGAAWNTAQPMRLAGADYKPSTKEWLKGQDVERDKQYFADQVAMRENIAGGKGINWKGGYYPVIQEGPNAGKVDYKGVPTAMGMFPGAEGAVPAMPQSTPWKSDTAAVGLESVLPPAAAQLKADATADRKAAAVDDTTASLIDKNRKAGPAIQRLSQPGQPVEDPTKQEQRNLDQRIADVKKLQAALKSERGDEFADMKEQLAEDKKNLESLKSQGLGYGLFMAAGELLKPGRTTTTGIGGALQAFGETGFKYQPQLIAARQGVTSSKMRLAEAQAAADRGDMQTASTLMGQFSQEDLARAKLAQDRELGLAQLDVQRAGLGRNTTLETLQAIADNPKLAAAAQSYHGYGERPLTQKDLLAGYDNFVGKNPINPATKKPWTLQEYADQVRSVTMSGPGGSGAGNPLLSAALAELQKRGVK